MRRLNQINKAQAAAPLETAMLDSMTDDELRIYARSKGIRANGRWGREAIRRHIEALL